MVSAMENNNTVVKGEETTHREEGLLFYIKKL